MSSLSRNDCEIRIRDLIGRGSVVRNYMNDENYAILSVKPNKYEILLTIRLCLGAAWLTERPYGK